MEFLTKQVYTVKEVCEILGISRGLAYEAIGQGQIPHIRIGKRLIIPRHALEEMLSANKSGGNI